LQWLVSQIRLTFAEASRLSGQDFGIRRTVAPSGAFLFGRIAINSGTPP
jgi:hypothetical protein